ncbi:MAG: hypothetical protein KC615_01905 [Anaerolineae bacterium]|nr:hypothetical protein [Anaerolineae bacterium]
MTDNDMSENNVSSTPETPIIPPMVFIWVAIIGLFVTLGAVVINGSLDVVGIGALAVSILAIVMWGVLNPEHMKNLLSGRAISFGGTAVLVTLVAIVASVLIYIVIREQNIRVDFSDSNAYTLTDSVREAVQIISADPNTPPMRIIGFYSSAQADQQEQIEVLLQEFIDAGGGKLSYELYDPDREPGLAATYDATPGSLFVIPLNADGSDNVEEAKAVSVADQLYIVDSMITASALGDFRLYWLVVDEGVGIDNAEGNGGSIITTLLQENLNWTVEPLTIAQLTNPESGPELGAAEDGEVLIIPGGISPLPDEAITALQDYVDQGGDIILLAGTNLEGDDSLATAPNMTDFLQRNYGVSVNNDLVIDPQATYNLVELDVFSFSDTLLTNSFGANDSIHLSFPHSINVGQQPDGVTVTVVASSTDTAYTKPNLNYNQEIAEETVTQSPDDPTGAMVVGAVAENANTGSTAIVWGATSPFENYYRQLSGYGLRNFDVAANSLFYAIGYEDFLANLPSLAYDAQPQDTPILADLEHMGVIRFVSLILIPFGVLAAGLFVWLSSRERRAEPGKRVA